MAVPTAYNVLPGGAQRLGSPLYDRYRAQLDEETQRQRQAAVIEVRAQRVELEQGSAAAKLAPEEGDTAALDSSLARRARHLSAYDLEAEAVRPAYAYAKAPGENEIALLPAPLRRGVLIDVFA